VSAACLAADGHDVTGVDLNADKVAMIQRGEAPIVEARLQELIRDGVDRGRLRAVTDARVVADADLSLICVGTPSRPNGAIDLEFVRRVSEDIGAALRGRNRPHVVAIRSTTLPGTARGVVVPAVEAASGRRLGEGLGVCSNPEFLREGTAVSDFRQPPLTVIGASDPGAGDLLATLYTGLPARIVRTDLEVAELVKYTANAWHALKVGFANEIGTVAQHVGVDSHRVMEIFLADTKLNVSAAYLWPGFAFGGSCLPKDVRAITWLGRSSDLDLPILNAVLPSNERQIARATEMVLARGDGPVGVLGLSFKVGTDDLRESPIVALIERLLGKGREVKVYDSNVRVGALIGTNREYIMQHIPHIARLLVDSVAEILGSCRTIVVANADPAFREPLMGLCRQHVVVDLVRGAHGMGAPGSYHGIAW
jgi:GDP-mannose 6-dehydrogenase